MPEPESTISDGSDDAEVESEIMQVAIHISTKEYRGLQ